MALRRPHPITVLLRLRSFLFLIILPVVRGFVSALQGGLAAWLSGAWFDLLILACMLALSILSWRFTAFGWNEEGFRVTIGLVRRRTVLIPLRSVSTLSVVHSFYLQPFHAAYIRLDTLGGGARNPDIDLVVRLRDGLDLAGYHQVRQARTETAPYRPRLPSLLVWSLMSSNSFVGILFLSTFISQSGKLLGEEFSHALVGTLHDLALTIAIGIPPAAAAIAIALLAGWFIAFLLVFLRYKNFSVRRRDRQMEVSGGIGTRREYLIDLAQVNYADIRQNILVRIFRLYSLYISAAGFAKSKNDVAALIPAERGEPFFRLARELLPELEAAKINLRPVRGSFFRYLMPAVSITAALPVLFVLLIRLFPRWIEFLAFVGLMFLAPAVLFLLTRISALSSAGLGKGENSYTMCYSFRYILHTVVLPNHRVACYEIRQNPFQSRKNACDLVLYSYSERRKTHRCMQLPLDQTERMMGLSPRQ